MRLVLMLIALLIVGLLTYKQIGPRAVHGQNELIANSVSKAPEVPSNPNDVKQFDKQINEFMKEEADKRAEAIENAVAQ